MIVTCCFPLPPFSSLPSSSLFLPPFSPSLPFLPSLPSLPPFPPFLPSLPSLPSLPPTLLSFFSQTRYDHHQSHGDSGLKQALAELIPKKQKEVKEFRAQHGGFVVGDVNIDMVSTHPSLSFPVSSFDLTDLSSLCLHCAHTHILSLSRCMEACVGLKLW